MEQKFVFVNRRKGMDRRFELDPCSEMSIDLFHRKRRKSTDRRDTSKTLSDDYYAYMQTVLDNPSQSERNKIMLKKSDN